MGKAEHGRMLKQISWPNAQSWSWLSGAWQSFAETLSLRYTFSLAPLLNRHELLNVCSLSSIVPQYIGALVQRSSTIKKLGELQRNIYCLLKVRTEQTVLVMDRTWSTVLIEKFPWGIDREERPIFLIGKPLLLPTFTNSLVVYFVPDWATSFIQANNIIRKQGFNDRNTPTESVSKDAPILIKKILNPLVDLLVERQQRREKFQ